MLSRSTPTIGFEHLPSAIAAKVHYDLPDDLEDTDGRPGAAALAADDGPPDNGVVRDPFGPAPTDARAPAGADPARSWSPRSPPATAASPRSPAGCDRQYAVVWRIIQRYGIDAGAYRRDGNG